MVTLVKDSLYLRVKAVCRAIGLQEKVDSRSQWNMMSLAGTRKYIIR
jgi:hypothetical protein